MYYHRRLTWAAFISMLCGCAAPLAPPVPVPPVPANPFSTTTAGDTTVVSVSPPADPCCEHPTLLDFLGITQCCETAQVCCNRTLAQLAFCFPGLAGALQPPGAVLPLTDPANLASDVPAIKKAAEIKAEEDLAPQKIAALRYLATIGCGGCYPSVEDAFLAALDDCTEVVRWEAVKALRDTSTCACQFCNKDACCSAKIQEKLRDMAEGLDEHGCPKEMSERVRRQARLALAECGPPPPAPAALAPEIPEEGPTEGPQEVPAEGPVVPTLPPPENPAPDTSASTLPSMVQAAGLTLSESPKMATPALIRLPSPTSDSAPAFPQLKRP